ncbi:putative oxygenase MesX [Aureimonas sp. Leaf324]|uniref:putative oxygenase MesX n=1 Tax=Aureimonas sp. Leaf324 TaxID=1736336 RepID=UPI0006F640C7|nr:putative oxygenase MesX [Aureimonas sp. Leaf324]KQQ91026.1 hypothetical protein ASF65_00355 [Aureimonas sp. Leaf324]
MTNSAFAFTISSVPFDEDYRPADHTRITTNFANLARGDRRRENLRNTLAMIDNRFNSLMPWDNPAGDRYAVELAIVTVDLTVGAREEAETLPLIEILAATVVDRRTGERFDGMVGNNLSSYVRDYDFSVRLADHLREHPEGGAPEGFGELHGNLFKRLLASGAYRERFAKPPVVCLSVSSRETYRRTANAHPILGVEYGAERPSRTDDYFARMGMRARYFLPPGGVAPLAFYHLGDLTGDYSNGELASTVAVMETFQKIYRPEIYNANSPAAEHYRPSLTWQDYSLTRIVYDRDERSRLAVEQGRFAEQHVIKPLGAQLERWSATADL